MELTSLAISMFSAIVLLGAIVLILKRVRAIEMRMILIGVFMAVQASVTGSGMSMVGAVSPRNAGAMVTLTEGGASLTKVAIILILGGVVVSLRPSPSAGSESVVSPSPLRKSEGVDAF